MDPISSEEISNLKNKANNLNLDPFIKQLSNNDAKLKKALSESERNVNNTTSTNNDGVLENKLSYLAKKIESFENSYSEWKKRNPRIAKGIKYTKDIVSKGWALKSLNPFNL